MRHEKKVKKLICFVNFFIRRTFERIRSAGSNWKRRAFGVNSAFFERGLSNVFFEKSEAWQTFIVVLVGLPFSFLVRRPFRSQGRTAGDSVAGTVAEPLRADTSRGGAGVVVLARAHRGGSGGRLRRGAGDHGLPRRGASMVLRRSLEASHYRKML